MRKALILLVLLAACGDDANPGACELDTTVPCTCLTGASGTRTCETDGSFSACSCEPLDAGVDAPDIDAAPAPACSPFSNNGCTGGQKCGWVQTQDTPIRGELACVPDGVAAHGEECTRTATGDDCEAGEVCVAGTCKTICELGGTGCGSAERCVAYGTVLVDAQGTSTHGVCERGCDPLTQLTYAGTACPSGEGCYLILTAETTVATCAAVGTATYGQALSPPIFANACVPGFQVRRRPGTNIQECGALCQVAEVTASVNAAVEGGVAPKSCEAQGAPAPSTASTGESCRYWYGREPFEYLTPYSNTVGFCYAHAAAEYDSDGDMFGDSPFPRCTTLTHGDVIPYANKPVADDAVLFWCAPQPASLHGKTRKLSMPAPNQLTDRSH